MNNIITIEGLSKVYKNSTVALDNINASIASGSLVGLIGANGAGKSTLIHIIAGILHPTTGTVRIEVKSPASLTWVSQATTLDWYLNVLDNVRLGARLGGASLRASYERAYQAMDLLQIIDLKDMNVELLSGGQQRRVQIARAFSQRAEVFFLDEPTIGLDYKACTNLMNYIRSLTTQGKTVVIASHDLVLLEKYIDQVWFLNDGKLEINQSLQHFLSQKEPDQESGLIIHYQGKPNDCLWKNLQEKGVQVLCRKPLEVELSAYINTNEFIAMLLPEIKIYSIQPKASILSRVYDALT